MSRGTALNFSSAKFNGGTSRAGERNLGDPSWCSAMCSSSCLCDRVEEEQPRVGVKHDKPLHEFGVIIMQSRRGGWVHELGSAIRVRVRVFFVHHEKGFDVGGLPALMALTPAYPRENLIIGHRLMEILSSCQMNHACSLVWLPNNHGPACTFPSRWDCPGYPWTRGL